MNKDELIRQLARQIDKNFDSQVEFLAEIVKANSANSFTPDTSRVDEPIEKKVAELIFKQLKAKGLSPKRIGASSSRPNVVVTYGAKRFRKSLVFNGHMDTLIGEDLGSENLTGIVRGSRIYGTGVYDMKASLAAYVFALAALKELDVELDGRVSAAFVVDEVPGACSEWGTAYLLGRGIKARAAIIGKPGTGTVAIGHRGGFRFKLTVRGEAVHTGLSLWEKKKMGRNAVVDMAEGIRGLAKVEIPFKTARLFPGRKPVFTFPTKIQGGRSINLVPDECVGYGDVRLMPGNSGKQVRLLIEEKMDRIPGINYEIEDLLFVPAVEIDPKEEVVLSLLRQAKDVLGEKPRVRGVGPWNDAWMYITRDIPSICGFGPDGGNGHGQAEWVSLPSLKQVTKIYAQTVVDFLGVKA